MRRLLYEIVGEIRRGGVAARAPRVVRRGTVAGLELLDRGLNPAHVVRVTEELSFVDAYVLRRSFSIDVSLDRIPQRERLASGLWPLGSAQQGVDAAGVLWTPLILLPRPVAGPIGIHDAAGEPVPRLRSTEVNRLLRAALHHMFSESLRDDPDFDDDDAPLGALMGTDDVARWTLYNAIFSVSAGGPDSQDSRGRLEEVRKAYWPHKTVEAMLRDDHPLPKVPPAQALAGPRGQALRVFLDKVCGVRAFMDLLGVVYGRAIVVAGLDLGRSDHQVLLTLPDTDAELSRERGLASRLVRTLDPREHNFTALVQLPVPPRVDEYQVQLRGSADGDGRAETSMAVAGAVALSPAPTMLAGQALRATGRVLATEARELGGSPTDASSMRPRLAKVAHAADGARVAFAALDSLGAQEKALVDDVSRRWAIHERRRWHRRQFPYFGGPGTAVASASAVVAAAPSLSLVELASDVVLDAGGLDEALDAIGTVEAGAYAGLAAKAGALADLVTSVGVAAEEVAADVQVASEEVPGREVGRLTVRRPYLDRAGQSEADSVDVWAAMSDHVSPYAATVLVVPACMLLLVWLFGSLLLESPGWFHSYDVGAAVEASVADRPADALAAVMLLIPGIALSRVHLPRGSSVRGKLQRAARLQVYTAVVATSVCALAVAAEVRATMGRSDLLLVVRTMRLTGLVFIGWLVWAGLAIWLRPSFVHIPKGFEGALATRRPWPGRYRRKAPDVTFDLRGPDVAGADGLPDPQPSGAAAR
jgi:hypothetical protein